MEYLYGEMESAARKSLETHVKGCAPCREKQGEFCGT
ncbi:MAG: zf-HC2 domain-containing protein, partial [Limisphaerales bacterium]